MASPIVLLVEDNEATRHSVRSTLETRGYGVIEAVDGSSAIELMRHQRCDLAVVDLILPDTDGCELAQALRRIPAGRRLPMLAVAGLMTKAEQARISAVGFDEVISKPIDPVRLVQLVQSCLWRSSVERDAARQEHDCEGEPGDRPSGQLE